MKCEMNGCKTELSNFEPIKLRTDGIIVEVLSTKRAYLICNDCASRFGLIQIKGK